MKDKSFTFPMPDEMRAWLEKYAEAEDMSVSQVIRLAIREFIKNKEGVK